MAYLNNAKKNQHAESGRPSKVPTRAGMRRPTILNFVRHLSPSLKWEAKKTLNVLVNAFLAAPIY